MYDEKTTTQLSVRLTEEMYRRLELEAKSQARPLANYVRAILIEHLETLDRHKNIAVKKKA